MRLWWTVAEYEIKKITNYAKTQLFSLIILCKMHIVWISLAKDKRRLKVDKDNILFENYWLFYGLVGSLLGRDPYFQFLLYID